MNYAKHYNSLIARAKNRIVEENIYYEKHHVIPRCMGGDDSADNIATILENEFKHHDLVPQIETLLREVHETGEEA